jgi:DNA-binding NtrC family response regulator
MSGRGSWPPGNTKTPGLTGVSPRRPREPGNRSVRPHSRREALRRAAGNKSQAARLLGLTRNALRYRLTQMGMEA